MSRPTEADEWLDELVTSWVEVYKKSVTTLVLLRIIDDVGPVAASRIGSELTERTGWSLTDRGLYRTLKRLVGMELLAVDSVAVPRTGLRRKDFDLTDLGRNYLARLEEFVATTG